MGRPFVRPAITEAGALGSAMMAGTGCEVFSSFQDAVDAMVRLDKTFEPDLKKHELYQKRFEQYKQAWPLLQDYLRALAAEL